MTDQELGRRLLDLATECEINGRDMTAQALRDAAAQALSAPTPNLVRHMQILVDQITRP